MPDITCSHCGEPWDIYELHDLRDPDTEKKRTFKEATALFAKYGCGAFNIFRRRLNVQIQFMMRTPHCGLLLIKSCPNMPTIGLNK